MKIDADGFSFDFTDALDAFVFDETDKSKATFHGAPMKAVDIIAEFKDAYVFVEMKRFGNVDAYDINSSSGEEELKPRQKHFNQLKECLKYKYRDSCLFRHAEQKVDKPIHYICIINFDNGLNMHMQKILKKELPVGRANKRWKYALAASCQVLNMEGWNRNFPKWPLDYTGKGASYAAAGQNSAQPA